MNFVALFFFLFVVWRWLGAVALFCLHDSYWYRYAINVCAQHIPIPVELARGAIAIGTIRESGPF